MWFWWSLSVFCLLHPPASSPGDRWAHVSGLIHPNSCHSLDLVPRVLLPLQSFPGYSTWNAFAASNRKPNDGLNLREIYHFSYLRSLEVVIVMDWFVFPQKMCSPKRCVPQKCHHLLKTYYMSRPTLGAFKTLSHSVLSTALWNSTIILIISISNKEKTEALNQWWIFGLLS